MDILGNYFTSSEAILTDFKFTTHCRDYNLFFCLLVRLQKRNTITCTQQLETCLLAGWSMVRRLHIFYCGAEVIAIV